MDGVTKLWIPQLHRERERERSNQHAVEGREREIDQTDTLHKYFSKIKDFYLLAKSLLQEKCSKSRKKTACKNLQTLKF